METLQTTFYTNNSLNYTDFRNLRNTTETFYKIGYNITRTLLSYRKINDNLNVVLRNILNS